MLALEALFWRVTGTIVGTAHSIVSKANDNQLCARVVAAVMLVLFTSLNAMDGVCCPDGCTHEQQSPSQEHAPDATDGICMLCLGGVDSSLRQELSPCAVTAGVEPPSLAPHLDAPSDRVEHPPRS